MITIERAILLFLLLVTASSNAVTRWVSTSGNDSNPGTFAQPYLTQQKAWDSSLFGDIIRVKPGIYNRSGFDTVTNYGVTLLSDQGLFSVTNLYGISIRGSWITNKDIIYPCGINQSNTSPNNYDAYGDVNGAEILVRADPFGNNPTNVSIENCWVYAFSNDLRGIAFVGHPVVVPNDRSRANGPQGCVMTHCLLANYDSSDVGPFETGGSTNWITYNVITNGKANWGVLIKGTGIYFGHNIVRGVGGIVHPDIFQSFSTGGATDIGTGQFPTEAFAWTIEDNIFGECNSLCEMETWLNPTNTFLPFGYHLIQNNIVINCNAFNNSVRGMAFRHNAFIDSFGGGMNFQAYGSNCWSRLDYWVWPGDSKDAIVEGNLFLHSPAPSFVNDTNSSVFYNALVVSNYFVDYNGTSWIPGLGTGPLTTNVNFTTYQTNVDNCYPGVVGNAASYYQISGLQPNNINTGADPKLVGGTSWALWTNYYAALRPMVGSPLINATTNFLIYDIEGTIRTITAGDDIGPFKFDPWLKFHFLDIPVTVTNIMDETGYANHAWNPYVHPPGYGTNWLYQTNITAGLSGVAAQFTTNGVMTNDPGQVYPTSTFAMVTNQASGLFTNMTQMTVSAIIWPDINVNGNLRIIDNGANQAFALGISSNSWMLGRNNNSVLGFTTYPGTNGIRDNVYFPDNVIHDQGNAPYDYSTAIPHLYTVTVDCIANKCISYLDGLPFSTNSIDLPYLHIYGATTPWLAIGARPHDHFSMPWDGTYPNDGWMQGRMSSVKLWNRTLSASEVLNLANSGTFAQSSGGGVSSSVTSLLRNNATLRLNNTTMRISQ